MKEKSNISSLFDLSGNLTLDAMERYLKNELNASDQLLVEKHLAESEFEREALEGFRKNSNVNFQLEVEDLQRDILFAAKRRARTESSGRKLWYAAAGLVVLMGLSVLMLFMFRNPVEKSYMAVAEQDTLYIPDVPPVTKAEAGKATEKEIIPASIPEKTASIPASPKVEIPAEEIDIVTEANPDAGSLAAEEPAISDASDIEAAGKGSYLEMEVQAVGGAVGGVAVEDNVVYEYNSDQVMMEEASVRSSRKAKRSNASVDNSISEPQPDSTGKYIMVEKMPEFPGGEKALYKFLCDSIQYPEMARQNNISGTVYIQFVVNEDGSITEIFLLRGIGGGCDEEAFRVVRLMPRWKPGELHGKPVPVRFNLPIKFTLQDSKKPESGH